MSKITFGEKNKEYYAAAGKDLPVSIMPKYTVAKTKGIDLIENGNYGLTEADFWILMNANKAKTKILYSGLIISHNGCLKINDALAENLKFKPSCVSLDKDGYNGSLVYSYCNDEQGIYEVGEVSPKNCKNDYPYAMAYKRLFDRVVLKNSKIAYDGIYSEAESDEFAQQYDDAPQQKQTGKTTKTDKAKAPVCSKCGKEIKPARKDGKTIPADEVAKQCGGLCVSCYKANAAEGKQ